MPFGLCNAPVRFKRFMERVLNRNLWEHCLCYLDDIIVFGTSFELAMENLKMEFVRVCKHGLQLQPKKYNLFKKVLYLGGLLCECSTSQTRS